MSYLQCPNCNEHINIFGKGGGQKISDDFKIPFLGEIPLYPQIMEGSDKGKPVIISQPNSIQANAISRVAKVVAGRISIIAAEINAEESQPTESTSVYSSVSTNPENAPSS
jgi:ATP-binding protein involved in chromosome partitioning